MHKLDSDSDSDDALKNALDFQLHVSCLAYILPYLAADAWVARLDGITVGVFYFQG
jgi:hypothetical protein